MEEVFEQLLSLLEQGETVSLSTVIGRSGSVPAPADSKFLVAADGRCWGTVGGGALEAEVLIRARQALRDKLPVVSSFDFSSERTDSSLQICGGRVSLYTEVIFPTSTEKEIFRTALARLRVSRSAALVTAVEPVSDFGIPAGKRMLFDQEGLLAGRLARVEWAESVRKAASAWLGQEDPLYLELEEKPPGFPRLEGFLVEFLHPAPTLIICGGGHIALPLCRIAAMCGFSVMVVDDRPEYAVKERFPEAVKTIHSDFSKAFDGVEVGPRHYIVSVTRCHSTDREVIRQAARLPAAYIGMIGSRRKVKLLWEDLRKDGLSPAQLKRVQAPIGLEIGAETPAEIAVSIAAQLVETRRSRKAGINKASLRF